MKEYVVYKGDNLLVIGSLKECAEYIGVKQETIQHYATPSYAKKGSGKNRLKAIRINDE